jgi:phage tail sheath protein FI
LRITAGYRGQQDPGTWGERLRIDVRDDPRGTTKLQVDTVANATSAQLLSLNGIRLGSVLRLVNAGTTSYRRITAINAGTSTVSWTGPIASILPAASTQVTTAEFRIIVRYQATPTSDFATVEDWPQLSMESDSPDYAVDRINHQFTGSRYITVSDISAITPSGEENPAVTSNRALGGSAEPAVTVQSFTGDAAQRTGVHAFNTAQVQLMAIPDVHVLTAANRTSIVRAALDYCAARGDCMFVGSAPDRGTSSGVGARALSDYNQTESNYVTTLKNYSSQFQASKVYGALYACWIRVNDPSPGPSPTRFVPPDGHLMGVYARTEFESGIFKAPAGNRAQVRGALQVSAAFTEEQHTDLVRNGFINGIRFTPGPGITIAGSRTLSTDTRWWFVNVRLLFNFVKSSLRDGIRFVRQEPHTEELRRMVRFNVVRPFLLGLWRQGAFGSDPADQVFTIKCDTENNPPAEVDLGNFKLEVYFYPVKPAETIIIVVGQQPGGSSAGEA